MPVCILMREAERKGVDLGRWGSLEYIKNLLLIKNKPHRF